MSDTRHLPFLAHLSTKAEARGADPARQAYVILRTAFTLAPIVGLWLLGIIVNLLLLPGYYDIALRDLGLLLASLALWRLASAYDTRTLPWVRSGS